MTHYIVSEQEILHRCPAWPEPHPYRVERTVLAVIPGGPCRSPVTIRVGNTTTTVPCGEHEPSDRQCVNCRTVITTYTSRPLDVGTQQTTPTNTALWRISDTPCPACGTPMAAGLDRHLLCPTPQRWCR